jgi:hypothetical protein
MDYENRPSTSGELASHEFTKKVSDLVMACNDACIGCIVCIVIMLLYVKNVGTY